MTFYDKEIKENAFVIDYQPHMGYSIYLFAITLSNLSISSPLSLYSQFSCLLVYIACQQIDACSDSPLTVDGLFYFIDYFSLLPFLHSQVCFLPLHSLSDFCFRFACLSDFGLGVLYHGNQMDNLT